MQRAVGIPAGKAADVGAGRRQIDIGQAEVANDAVIGADQADIVAGAGDGQVADRVAEPRQGAGVLSAAIAEYADDGGGIGRSGSVERRGQRITAARVVEIGQAAHRIDQRVGIAVDRQRSARAGIAQRLAVAEAIIAVTAVGGDQRDGVGARGGDIAVDVKIVASLQRQAGGAGQRQVAGHRQVTVQRLHQDGAGGVEIAVEGEAVGRGVEVEGRRSQGCQKRTIDA